MEKRLFNVYTRDRELLDLMKSPRRLVGVWYTNGTTLYEDGPYKELRKCKGPADTVRMWVRMLGPTSHNRPTLAEYFLYNGGSCSTITLWSFETQEEEEAFWKARR